MGQKMRSVLVEASVAAEVVRRCEREGMRNTRALYRALEVWLRL